MSRIPRHIVDEILSTARIEEVIGQFVNLKRAGSNLKGLSPFADEKTPSFVVSPAKQIFKDFSSGKAGNVVSFLMEKEHYTYPEALRWLAEKYNIAIPEDQPLTAEELAQISERESLHIINEFAKKHFIHNLHETDEGKAIGLSYFQERGVRPEIIEAFELGYCLESGNDLTQAALAKGYRLEYLETVGLTKTKDGRSFDFYRGRVIFPIHSITGRVIGFGGRTLRSDKHIAKYFNSPESIIYNKSETLYGLFLAKGDIVKYDNCYLVEGYMDVISFYQAGVHNVVASSGTSLTQEQIRMMRRYTNNITVLYDGDAAGIKASFRGIDMLLEEGLTIQVVLLPDGDDPDSFSKRVSTEELEQFLKENKKDFISFKADILLKDNANDPIQKVHLIHDMVHSISLIPDAVTRTIYMQEISDRFEVEKAIILKEVEKQRIKKSAESRNASPEEVSQLQDYLLKQSEPTSQDTTTKPATKSEPTANETEEIVEKNLIRMLVEYGQYAIQIQQQTETKEVSVAELIQHELLRDNLSFKKPLYIEIFQFVSDGLEKNEFYKPSFFIKSPNQEIVKLVSEFATTKYELSNSWLLKYKIETATELDKLKNAVFQSIYAFKMTKVSMEIEAIRAQLDAVTDEKKLLELIGEQVLLEKIKVKIAEEMGRTISNV